MKKRIRYTFKYNPSIYKYIMSDTILSDKYHEKQILEMLVNGYTCQYIGEQIGYSERTIKRRRKDIYNKTKDLMIV